jgi:hypothetical protein
LVSGFSYFWGDQFNCMKQKLIILTFLIIGKITVYSQVLTIAEEWDTPIRSYEEFNLSDIYHDSINNRVYLAGDFTAVSPRAFNACLFNPVNNTLVRDLNANSYVLDAQPDGSGGYFISGLFTTINDSVRNAICQIDQSGNVTSLDIKVATASSSSSPSVQKMINLNDTLYIVGEFDSINGVYSPDIAAIDLNTNTLIPWATNAFFSGISDFVIVDSVMYVVGNFSFVNGIPRKRFAALNRFNGALLPWNPFANSDASSITKVWVNNNNIYLSGNFTTINSVNRNRVCAFDLSSEALTSWNPNVNYEPNTLIFKNQSIYIAGAFTTVNGVAKKYLAKLDTITGLMDPSWNPVATSYGMATVGLSALEYNNELIVSGSFIKINNQYHSGIAVIDFTNGNLTGNTLNDSHMMGFVNEILELGGNQFVLGGFTRFGGKKRLGIAALDASSGALLDWDPRLATTQNIPQIVKLQLVNDVVYFCGRFDSINGQFQQHLSAVDNITGNNVLFTPLLDNGVDQLEYYDNELFVSGAFSAVNGAARSRLCSFDVVTNQLTNWNPSTNAWVKTIKVKNNTVYICGFFTQVNGIARQKIAAIDRTTSALLPWYPQITSVVNANAMLILDSTILIGGRFNNNTLNGTNYLKEFSLSSGTLINHNYNFNLYPNYATPGCGVDALAKTNNFLLVGGIFAGINGSNHHNFSILNLTDQSPVMSYPGSFAGSYQTFDKIQAHGNKVFVGGAFNYLQFSAYTKFVPFNACYPSYGSAYDTAACSYSWGGNTLTTSGTYLDTLVNATGCDSILTLHLEILNSQGIINVTECGSYTWSNGNTYTNSGTFTDTLVNMYGCDSIVTLNLTINNLSLGTDNQTVCDSLLWIDGTMYYSSTNIPTFVLQNAAGCDSIITLNLTITNSNTGTDLQTACDSYTWIDGNTYYSSTNTPTFVLQNAAGCDSIITLDLTIIPPLPLTIENSFSMPSDANSCVGEVAIDVSGNADFELDFDNGSQVINSSGYSLVTNLCPGVHDLHVTDNCGDTLSLPVVIPIDSNFVFNNPFIDSLAQDSLGVTMTNCDIYYAGIDTAYIDSIWATGNTVNVIWNIVDSNGSNFDTTSYALNNGNGVYWLQLSVFCPNKSLGEYFTVTEAIYFNNGSVSTAGLADYTSDLFEIYPNPTNDQAHISFSGSNAELIVYDLQGKVVLKDRIQNNGIVSLQNFERGVYLFDFKNSQGHSVQRVVKQ